jgi:hypothetical protein
VAVSCYIRATLRGLLAEAERLQLLPHELLVRDFNSVIKCGLYAKVNHPKGPTARSVCEEFYRIACEYALDEEKPYLPIVKRRIDEGNLSEITSSRVKQKAQKTEMHEAILDVYADLIQSLTSNEPYF